MELDRTDSDCGNRVSREIRPKLRDERTGITELKKVFQELTDLLDDGASPVALKRLGQWSNLVRDAVRGVQNEIEHRAAGGRGKARAAAASISSFTSLKTVLKHAVAEKATLSTAACAELFDHILAIMFGRVRSSSAGFEFEFDRAQRKEEAWVPYCEIVLGMLSSTTCCRQISAVVYKELCEGAMRFLEEAHGPGAQRVNKQATSKAAEMLTLLIRAYPEHLDEDERWLSNLLHELFEFFGQYFDASIKKTGENQLAGVAKKLLHGFNSLWRKQGMNATLVLGEIMEMVTDYCLHNWPTADSDSISDELIQTMRLMLTCDHVGLETIRQMGQDIADDIPRQSKLHQKACAFGRPTLEKSTFGFCDFAAEVFIKLCGDSSASEPIVTERDATGAATAKRQRRRHSDVEVFGPFLPMVHFKNPADASKLWFQILYSMICKSPAVLDSDRCMQLLKAIAPNLSLLQEFDAAAQPWVLIMLRRLLFIEESLLGAEAQDPPEASSGPAAGAASQGSEGSQQPWERTSERRADVASERKVIWQEVWANCVSIAKSCTDPVVIREVLHLLEAVMLTDRISPSIAVDTESFFAWDAAVLTDRHVQPAVWRFLYVRIFKYKLGVQKCEQVRPLPPPPVESPLFILKGSIVLSHPGRKRIARLCLAHCPPCKPSTCLDPPCGAPAAEPFQ